ncbi:MAG: hypothetical protein OEW09_06750, partial [Anaerolineae bacterium]|nr:hypothetical protein [Anaerolineae bacterium]
MVKRIVYGAVLALIALSVGLWVAPAGAQQYAFSVDKNISHVYINKDGSVDVEYWITFTCQPGYHPIDIVDIG